MSAVVYRFTQTNELLVHFYRNGNTAVCGDAFPRGQVRDDSVVVTCLLCLGKRQ